MYSAFKSAQSNVAEGTDITSRMASSFGGGGSGVGGGGSASPLGAAMGLAPEASGGMGGGSSAMSAKTSTGGETSGGGSEDSGGSDGGAGGMTQVADAGAGGASSSGSDSGSSGSQVVDGGQSSSGSASSASTGATSSSKLGTAGRIAMDMGANLVSGMGRMAQSRIDQTMGGKLAAEISNPGSSSKNSNLDTGSASRSFDPASEVAAYRDSKQENS